LYQANNLHAKAIELHERNLAILDASHDESFTQWDQLLSSLAISYRAMGLFAKSEQCWKRCVIRTEALRGAEHPESAMASMGLASFLAKIGRFEEAMPILQRASETLARSCAAEDVRHEKVRTWMSIVQSNLAGRAETERWTRLREWPLKTVSDASMRVTLRLPETWQLSQHAGTSTYRDVKTPQYNFVISSSSRKPAAVYDGQSALEVLKSIVCANPTANLPEFHAVGSDCAVACYLSRVTEDAHGRKDDRHWCVLKRGRNRDSVATVVCTLSVLADIARKNETEALTEMLTTEIKRIRFEPDAADPISSPFVN
jgi:tetratricopeptide (TPR) repeat protein